MVWYRNLHKFYLLLPSIPVQNRASGFCSPRLAGGLTKPAAARILNGYPRGYGGMADAPDLGSGAPGVQVQVLLPAPSSEQSPLCSDVFLCLRQKKDAIRPLPCSSSPNRTRCAGLRFGFLLTQAASSVSPLAPNKNNPNLFPVGDWFGLFFSFHAVFAAGPAGGKKPARFPAGWFCFACYVSSGRVRIPRRISDRMSAIPMPPMMNRRLIIEALYRSNAKVIA